MAEKAAIPPTRLDPVAEDEDGSRLDALLAARLGGSRGRLQRLVREGMVEVDGRVALRPSAAVRRGAVVEVWESAPEAEPAEPVGEPRIVYQDQLLAVVDKPAGLVVHPAPGHRGPTLADLVRTWPGPWSVAGGEERPGIVHRLDRDTSGLLVLARTEAAHGELSRQLRAREMGREYWGLARGRIQEARGRVDAAVGKDRSRPGRMRVSAEGRDASTEFSVLERLPTHSALRLRLLSGRTHQIRVHLAYIGHPLEGDRLYGGARLEPGRPALHAAMLHLRHPGTGGEMTFCSPLPEDLERARLGAGAVPGSRAPWPWRELAGAIW